MNNFSLEVNDRVEVIAGDRAYKALIIDIQDDFLRINLPVYDGEYLVLNNGEEIEINSYLDENRCFSFNSKILSRGKEGSIIYYELSEPFNMKKIQRRNFFRVALLREIQYKIVTDVDKEDIDNISYKEGLMVDLSAGGLKLKVNNDIKENDLLLVKIELNDMQLEINCDIVRIEDTMDKEKLCGLRFIDITPVQSEMIIKELFKIVRKQRANA